jgi:phage baseplate assembly protein W
MASINLKTIKPDEDLFTLAEDRTKSQKDGWKWVDLKLDLSLGDILTNVPTDQKTQAIDAQVIMDEDAVRQAVKNIFNTMQGEKLLNPLIGLDLRQYLFDPISETTATRIANTIVDGLVDQEPRISVKNIKIEGVISEESYYISFVITFPDLPDTEVTVDGKLTSSGFALTSENKSFELSSKRVARDRYWNFDK